MPRKATPLTDSALKVAKPKDKPYKLVDGQGLYLEVMANGSKIWRLKFRFGGKENRLTFGAYPTMPLQLARKKREEARLLLAEGKDPSAERKAEQEAQQSNAITFEALAREWHAYRTPRWAKSTADKTATYLESDLLPALGNRPVKAITRPELAELIRRIESRGGVQRHQKGSPVVEPDIPLWTGSGQRRQQPRNRSGRNCRTRPSHTPPPTRNICRAT